MNSARNSKIDREPGWVYVIDNQAMPEMVKVGYTSRHPEERLKDNDYSVSTGMPLPYQIAFAMKVDAARKVEHAAHKQLPGRVTQPGVKGNEWFRCGAIEAVKIAAKTAVKQHKPIWEYYNPRGMNTSGLPAPAGADTQQDWNWLGLGIALVVLTIILLVGYAKTQLLWLWEAITWLLWLVWQAITVWLTDALPMLPELLWLVWEAITWLLWLVWQATTWLLWLVWEAITWLL